MVKTTAIVTFCLLALVSLVLAIRAVSADLRARALDLPSGRERLAAARAEVETLARSVMDLEPRSEESRESACELDVASEAAALAAEATSRSVDLDRMEIDFQRQSLAATASGRPQELREWLQRMDEQTAHGCAAVTSLHISASAGGEITMRIAAVYSPHDVRAHGVSGHDEWPRPAAGRLSAVLSVDPLATDRAASMAGVSRPEPQPAVSRVGVPVAPPVYLGAVSSTEPHSTTVRERIVVRIGEAGPVAALLPGEGAFGWLLRAAGADRLILEHEGEQYEVIRH